MSRLHLIVFLLGVIAFFAVRRLADSRDSGEVNPVEPVTSPERPANSNSTPIWDRSGRVELCSANLNL
jgi:hypothetical protein